tara:strand:+ start:119 stop:463 length:345 start_codon:yes stop_codon:yes gene_type:complete
MTTTVSLTEEQVSRMKDNSVVVIMTGCDDKAASDKSLPTTAYLIECDDGEKQWKDIVMGYRVPIFDSYWDAFKKNVIQKISWTSGTMNPKTWGKIKSAPPPRKKRKRKSTEDNK